MPATPPKRALKSKLPTTLPILVQSAHSHEPNHLLLFNMPLLSNTQVRCLADTVVAGLVEARLGCSCHLSSILLVEAIQRSGDDSAELVDGFLAMSTFAIRHVWVHHGGVDLDVGLDITQELVDFVSPPRRLVRTMPADRVRIDRDTAEEIAQSDALEASIALYRKSPAAYWASAPHFVRKLREALVM